MQEGGEGGEGETWQEGMAVVAIWQEKLNEGAVPGIQRLRF